MEQTTVDLRLLLHVEGERMTGQVEAGGDDPRTFSGWLGFVSVLDALIAEATATTAASTNGSQHRRS